MFGTRDLFIKGEKINQVAERRLDSYAKEAKELLRLTVQSNLEQERVIQIYIDFLEKKLQEDSQIFYLRRIYQQAKQVSQIIAYIWRWIDDATNPKQEIAKQLKKYFAHPTKENTNVGGNLENLFAANPREDNLEQNADEANLLREVFPNYNEDQNLIFPIFNKFERGEEVSGLGYLLTVDINSYQGNLSDTSINHPYLFIHTIPFPPRPQLSDATVTPDELKDWIENKIPGKYYADNLYIPTTST
ncbi:hypothetical protein [Nostoc sp. 'Peltigera malacea cyanobiont' DB3992]|uniref:hypothetical protein n=1 Tax=Nostoc sp. 'Peltigera malacea cyanobiont' DB3992 TaxID=1206980 RepID=UPI000C039AED|nr:hypothetical protein [Nostoc sp. 'Peltigera malacea cyanobiont' DB3992]PHM06218.1 hypothetical protein CK516_35200 [Nostoc sp. 'Peltigera malacea cyanobiont' DB3992]